MLRNKAIYTATARTFADLLVVLQLLPAGTCTVAVREDLPKHSQVRDQQAGRENGRRTWVLTFEKNNRNPFIEDTLSQSNIQWTVTCI